MLALALGVLTSRTALAQSATDSATAESLFNEALALLADQEAARACVKLEESQRLDPGVGTLLYLADCYQQLGRTASAWATFRDAAYLAKIKADEREALAIEYALALEPQLSYLTLEVTSEPGVELKLVHDGKPVSQALWGTAFPVDPGAHHLDASAAGKRAWSHTLDVPEGPSRERVVVPLLQAAEPRAAAVLPAALAEPRGSGVTQATVGWVLLGAGGAGVMTGGILALLARADDSDARARCRPDRVRLCDPAGVALGESAHLKATWAGVSTGIGLAALGAGLTLLLTASTREDAPASAIALDASMTPDGGRLSFATTW
jgi:serine/threonine-protein kinase